MNIPFILRKKRTTKMIYKTYRGRPYYNKKKKKNKEKKSKFHSLFHNDIKKI